MTAFSGGLLQRGPNLLRRILYTVALLFLFRVLATIPALNVDEERLHHLLADNPLIGTVDLFAGGEVMTHFSVAAAGIFPYLLALVLMQTATWIIPSLRELRHQGEHGQKTIERYSKILTVPLAFAFAWALSQYLAQQTGLFPGHIHWFTSASFFPSLRVVSLVTAGSVVSTWIVHVITNKGVGAGESVVLLAGSSYGFAKQILKIVRESPGTSVTLQRLGLVVVGGLVVMVLSTYLLESVRKIPIQYAKRQTPSRLKERVSAQSYLPLMLNNGGTLPVSAAMGVLILLQLGFGFLKLHIGGKSGAVYGTISNWIASTSSLYWAILACLIVLFAYIYNFSRIWESNAGGGSIADALKQSGSYIPGVRPGDRTQEYLSRIMAAITFPGGVGLAFLAAGLPYTILLITKQNVIVTVLALMVMVKAIYTLGGQLRYYRTFEAYEGFLKSSRKRSWIDRLLEFLPGELAL